ncbi:MAG: hypothetical protein IH958_02505 [Chloroflexi bacterium]|nr:hypothetical protein [Chloroflexota bacterium]
MTEELSAHQSSSADENLAAVALGWLSGLNSGKVGEKRMSAKRRLVNAKKVALGYWAEKGWNAALFFSAQTDPLPGVVTACHACHC